MDWKIIELMPETGGNLDLATAIRFCVFAEEISHRAIVNSFIDPEEGEDLFKIIEKQISAPRLLIEARIAETLEGEDGERAKRLKDSIKILEEQSRIEIRSVYSGADPVYSADGKKIDIDWDQLLRNDKL